MLRNYRLPVLLYLDRSGTNICQLNPSKMKSLRLIGSQLRPSSILGPQSNKDL